MRKLNSIERPPRRKNAYSQWINMGSVVGAQICGNLLRFFEGLGRLTYHAADPIIALYEGNRQRQIHDGARPERTNVIPNGIDTARFHPNTPDRFRIGWVGHLEPKKNPMLMMQIAHRMRLRDERFSFHIAGGFTGSRGGSVVLFGGCPAGPAASSATSGVAPP